MFIINCKNYEEISGEKIKPKLFASKTHNSLEIKSLIILFFCKLSARSHCFFHQIEGLAVDQNLTFSDLKGTLEYFVKEFFGKDLKTKFIPHFFPFTEPSAEVLVSWKDGEWLEILGCGMVDPNVFKHVGYDKDSQGFAFGVGVERLAMIRYGIDHIKNFYENDLRFLRQF